ncbi:MAG: hypothetical protein CM1200mP39_24340 [Dehalococcoidia bacterium]|nr:MAG: hypothetical protein CM1200mP39_24340 [Dehalococcoidia bacterium]
MISVTVCREKKPVTQVVGEKIPATLQLGLAGWTLATVVGVPLGILSAWKRGSMWDYLGRSFALLGQALPQFWVGIMAVLFFA